MTYDFCQLQITCPTRDEALALAKKLVKSHLAACSQVTGPITSLCYWEGEFKEGEEWLVLAKTRLCIFDEVTELILSHHSYKVPQVIALPIVASSPDYQRWLEEQIQ